jgi:hypothetical protein
VGLILEVVYASPAGLRHDYDTQLKVGGLFARLQVPPGLPPLASLQLLLRVADEGELQLAARLTVATTDTLCVELDAASRGDVALWVEQVCGDQPADPSAGRGVRLVVEASAARADDSGGGAVDAVDGAANGDRGGDLEAAAEPEVEVKASAAAAPAGAAGRAGMRSVAVSPALPVARRIDLMSVAEKVHLAQHGERDARGILSRDRAGVVQCALVRNPRMGADEIVSLARNPQLSADCAEALTQHPTYGRSPEVAFALCRNPRTPLPIVTQLITRLSQNDLRTLAKGLGVRTQVAMAARKRLFNT